MITRLQVDNWLNRKLRRAVSPFEQVDILGSNPEVQAAKNDLAARWEQTRPAGLAPVVPLRPSRSASVTNLAEFRAARRGRNRLDNNDGVA